MRFICSIIARTFLFQWSTHQNRKCHYDFFSNKFGSQIFWVLILPLHYDCHCRLSAPLWCSSGHDVNCIKDTFNGSGIPITKVELKQQKGWLHVCLSYVTLLTGLLQMLQDFNSCTKNVLKQRVSDQLIDRLKILLRQN